MGFIVFIIGLAIGSFLNAWIWRSRHNVLVWRGRSRCPKCRKILHWFELIPVVSFFIQRGKCRGCKKTIDWQYPLVELATGVLFALAYTETQSPSISEIGSLDIARLFVVWYMFAALIVLFVYDLRYGLVPDRVVLPAIAVAFVYNLFSNSRELENSVQPLIHDSLFLILSIIVGAGFFVVQYYLSHGKWLGAGDIRIGALMGAMLGWPLIIEGLVISYIMGGAVALALLVFGKKKFGQTLPLGTFLTLGTAIAFLYGQEILRIYLG